MRTLIASLLAAGVLSAGFVPLAAEAARHPQHSKASHAVQAKKAVKKKAPKKVVKKTVKKVKKTKPHA